MLKNNWLIYGAYGYTGALLVELAISKGYEPILAGRNYTKLQRLAKKYSLSCRTFDLTDPEKIIENIEDLELLVNCAGPFVETAPPLIMGCLTTRTHYMDISGEVESFEYLFEQEERAVEMEIGLVSGVGFDVIPSDYLSNFLIEKIPNANRLTLCVESVSRISSGTMKTIIHSLSKGGLIRKNGELISCTIGKGQQKFKFPDNRFLKAIPFPLADLVSIHRSTGIPNITTFMTLSESSIQMISSFEPMLSFILSNNLLKLSLQKWIEWNVKVPEPNKNVSSYIYAQIENEIGIQAEAWIKLPESYKFTATALLHCTEKIIGLKPKGAYTPVQLFGIEYLSKLPILSIIESQDFF